MENQQLRMAEDVLGPSVPDGQPEVGSWVNREVALEAWERQHKAEWERLDQQLRGVAARRAGLDAEEARLLRYAEELKLWRAFGFGHLLEYMERAMGYAPHTAAERLRVARAIGDLPVIAEALEKGELAHSAVRELSRVAVPDTEEVWLDAVRGKSLREIEAMVSGRRPGDLPTDETQPRLHRKTITIEISPETYDLWRRMHALAAEEHGQRLSDDELITSVFRRAYSDEHTSREGAGSPAYKIAIKQCPDCKRAWQYSGGRDIEIDPAVAECASCDAIHLGSLDAATPERITTTVTARKREQVLARDGHCCTVPGCRRNVGLDLHHIEFQSHGGGHELGNLSVLCDLHHRAVHRGKLVIRGTAPDRLRFEFRKPRDRRNVTDDDAESRHSCVSSPTVTHSQPSAPGRAEKTLVGCVSDPAVAHSQPLDLRFERSRSFHCGPSAGEPAYPRAGQSCELSHVGPESRLPVSVRCQYGGAACIGEPSHMGPESRSPVSVRCQYGGAARIGEPSHVGPESRLPVSVRCQYGDGARAREPSHVGPKSRLPVSVRGDAARAREPSHVGPES